MTTESFGDIDSQELYSACATPPNHVGSKGLLFKAHAHLTSEAHTCKSNLKSDDNTVELEGLTGKRKSVKQEEDSKKVNPLCSCDKTLSQGSYRDKGSCLRSLQQSPGDQMNVSGLDALNNPILTLNNPESDNPPLPSGGTSGKTRELTRKMVASGGWILYSHSRRKSAHPFVSLLMKITNDHLDQSGLHHIFNK
jgi:hypothetical protein